MQFFDLMCDETVAFLLTPSRSAMDSESGVRVPDSHRCFRHRRTPPGNRRTVHGPQPRPGEARPIQFRSGGESRSWGLYRAKLGDVDGTQRDVPRCFASFIGMRAAVARGDHDPPRRIRRMHIARRKTLRSGTSRQRRSDRRPDELGPPNLPSRIGGRLAGPAAWAAAC
jgi:hypothetical protein